LPEAGESLYALCVDTKTALVLGGGGITGGMYELGALSALDDFIVSGGRSGEFDLYVGISAGSIPAAFLANGITVSEMCSAVLGKGDQGLLLRREDIYELSLGKLLRSLGRCLRNLGPVARHLKASGQPATFLNFLAVLQQFLPAGFFSNANLERYVARTLSGDGRSNDFRAVSKPLAIVATEVDTGERWVFGEGGRKDIPVSKAIQASTAIPVFFEPVLIEERYFVDGAAERVGHLDLPAAAGADLIVMINPIVPIWNDRSVVCIPTLDGQCRSLTERGVTAIAEQTFRINSRVKLELGTLLFRAEHPGTDLLVIEPSPAESSLFLYGSMNFAERVHSLNYGYNSSVHYFVENYDMLRDTFARHGMEVSLERLTADRFLQQAVVPAGRRKFGLTRQQSSAPGGGGA
jgi:predicted acylesterase/phospholipase RssA